MMTTTMTMMRWMRPMRCSTRWRKQRSRQRPKPRRAVGQTRRRAMLQRRRRQRTSRSHAHRHLPLQCPPLLPADPVPAKAEQQQQQQQHAQTPMVRRCLRDRHPRRPLGLRRLAVLDLLPRVVRRRWKRAKKLPPPAAAPSRQSQLCPERRGFCCGQTGRWQPRQWACAPLRAA
jgi:hypothetical protein